ncbi:uncharacterized protein [Typha latifolia]|uniref:uncharacterized protein isoform X2 n=1 Tax=Typha latifolia TaxID=4733 RepID=UPI003C307C5D
MFTKQSASSMEKHLDVNRPPVQLSVAEPVVTSNSNLADDLILLTLKNGSMMQLKPTSLLREIKEYKNRVKQLENEHRLTKKSIKELLSHIDELDQCKESFHHKLQQLQQLLDGKNCSSSVQDLIEILKLLKAVEVEESELWFESEQLHTDKQFTMLKLEKKKSVVGERECSITIDDSVNKSFNKLDFIKKELAAILRTILSVRRQIDDVPTQPELIQYERRFSELFLQIQEKHRQTHKLYATYNTLLEIKELMLKETSLLNSINSQFNDAMTNTISCSKLVDSMENITKGTQQKLEKVQHSLVGEQKNSIFLKEKYAAATTEQRLFSSLLKAFQVSTNSNKDLWKSYISVRGKGNLLQLNL